MSGEGFTVLVRHAERHHQKLKKLAIGFEKDSHAPANIHIYATPTGRHGFSWRYDVEDVFIMQTSSKKEYSLRKNTVHPWPLVETIPYVTANSLSNWRMTFPRRCATSNSSASSLRDVRPGGEVTFYAATEHRTT